MEKIKVGLLCGWFASGKTTILRSLITTLRATGHLRLAVVHNCVSPVAVDRYVTESDINGWGGVKVYTLEGCCACCSGKTEFAALLQTIAKSRQVDYILVEAAAQAHPQFMASVVDDIPALKMDAIISVIDASSFLQEYGMGKEDSRRLELLNSQLGSAQVVIVNKKEGGEGPRLDSALPIILRSVNNPSPSITHTQTGQIASEVVLNTGLYRSKGITVDTQQQQRKAFTAVLVYESDQAFHPERLYRLLTSGTSHLKATRAKGRFLLASRAERAGIWSYPAPLPNGGAGTALEGGLPWRVISQSDPTPKTSLVFLDAGATKCVNEASIRRLLDACLVKDTEQHPFPDRFPSWGAATSPHPTEHRPSTATDMLLNSATAGSPKPIHHQHSRHTSTPVISPTMLRSAGRGVGLPQAAAPPPLPSSVPSEDMASFVAEVKEQTNSVTNECEALAELVERASNSIDRRRAPVLSGVNDDGSITAEEEDESDPAVAAALKGCVLVTSRLVDSVVMPFLKTANARRVLAADKEAQMRNAAMEVRESVVAYVRACSEVINNPVDFMASQKAKSQLARVRSAVNTVLSLVLALQLSHSASSPQSNRTPARSSMHSPSVNPRQEEDRRAKEEVVLLVEQAAEGLREVGAAVEERSTLRFVTTTKSLIAHCTALIDAANAHPPPDQDAFFQEKERLEDVMLSFVTHGRKLFTSHERDEELEDIWEESKRELARSIKVVSLAVLSSLQGDDSPSRHSSTPPLVATRSIQDLDLIIHGSDDKRQPLFASPAMPLQGEHGRNALSIPDARSRGRGAAPWMAGSPTSRPPIPARSAKPKRNLAPLGGGNSKPLVLPPFEKRSDEEPVQTSADWNQTLRNKDKGADVREQSQAIHSYSEWRKHTGTRHPQKKAALAQIAERNLDENVEDHLDTLSTVFSDVVVNFVITANEYALSAHQDIQADASTATDVTVGEAATQILRLLKGMLKLCYVASARCQTSGATLNKILDTISNQLNAAPVKGTPDKYVLKGAETPHLTASVIRLAQQRIFYKSNDVLALGTQGLAFLQCDTFLRGSGSSTLGSTVQSLAAVIASLTKDIGALLDLVETTKEVYREKVAREKREKRGSTYGISAADLLDNLQDDVSIWDEGKEDTSNLRRGLPPAPKEKDGVPAPVSTQRPVVLAGSLNKLVECLTSDTDLDATFMNTFITTYQSFTSAWKLLEKLQQRYHVPSDIGIESSRVGAIQMRVTVVVKHWVENQFLNFDEELVGHIVRFIEDTVKNDNPRLYSMLAGELSSRTSARTKQIKALFIQPTEIVAPNISSVHQLFTKFKPLEIAQMLTTAEFDIYSKIEATELLKQSWSKDSLQHNSPHVLMMINRANRLAGWIAGLILAMDTPKERKSIFSLIISVCEELEKLNNFHTLMGVIVGINTSPISRLANTKKDLKTKDTKTFKRLEDLMNPEGSFSAYRKRLREASPPIIPYLGVYMSDLTFMEDGNPDKIEHLINFGKRRLIYRVIEEVKQYQSTPYTFRPPTLEPLYTFVRELPTLTEGQLFDLSLFREPRRQQK